MIVDVSSPGGYRDGSEHYLDRVGVTGSSPVRSTFALQSFSLGGLCFCGLRWTQSTSFWSDNLLVESFYCRTAHKDKELKNPIILRIIFRNTSTVNSLTCSII